MITRKKLFEWLNTCPDRRWEVMHDHEDEGHLSVLFSFDEDDEELELSDHD